MLKHLPSDALKTIAKTLLYNKQPAYFAQTQYDRRNHNGTGADITGLNAADAAAKKAAHVKDLNIDKRISLFQNQLKNDFVYRIHLRYLCNISKINFPTKIDYKIKLETWTDCLNQKKC